MRIRITREGREYFGKNKLTLRKGLKKLILAEIKITDPLLLEPGEHTFTASIGVNDDCTDKGNNSDDVSFKAKLQIIYCKK